MNIGWVSGSRSAGAYFGQNSNNNANKYFAWSGACKYVESCGL